MIREDAMTDGRLLLKDLIDERSVRALAAAVAGVQPGLVVDSIFNQVFGTECLSSN